MESPDKVVGLRKSTVELIGIILIIVALGGLTGNLVLGSGFNNDTASSVDEELISQGRRIYRDNCARCHGRRGQGGGIGGWGPPHNNAGHTWEHSDGELMSIVLEGRFSRMPAFQKKLTEPEVEAVLTYIKSMWDDDQRDYQRGLNP